MNGVPNVRIIHASRTLPGPADVDNWMTAMLDALTRPLTAKEKENGQVQPRGSREYSLKERWTMLRSSTSRRNTFRCRWRLRWPSTPTVFPIIVPTEERVQEDAQGNQPQARRDHHPPGRCGGHGGAWIADAEEGREGSLPAHEADRHRGTGGDQRRHGRVQAGASAGGTRHRRVRAAASAPPTSPARRSASAGRSSRNCR